MSEQRPTLEEKRRSSLGKYVKRFKTVLRRHSSSGQKNDKSSPTPAGATLSQPETVQEQASTMPAGTIPLAAEDKPLPLIQDEPKPTSAGVAAETLPVTSRSTAQQERARALFEKYGLTLEPHEWITTPPASTIPRIEKPIRMRVRRTCHRCQTLFGATKVCSNCNHNRCKKCPRYPPKKEDRDRKGKGKEKEAVGGITGAAATTVSAIKTKLAPPQEPVKPFTGGRQKVTEAGADIAPADEADTEAKHDLSKREWKKPRVRVRWTCDQCSHLFTEGSKTCPSCGHERCGNCTRKPPKHPNREEQEPDPEVLKALEGRLASLNVAESS